MISIRGIIEQVSGRGLAHPGRGLALIGGSDVTQSIEAGRRLSDAQWLEVERLYAQGDTTTRALAQRFGVSKSAVQAHCQGVRVAESTDRPGERWLPIAGFEGYYEVSDLGRIRALFKVPRKALPPRILGDKLKPTGRIPYWQVTLCAPPGRERGLFRHALIHQLVLEAFVGLAPEGMECRHLDGDPDNNFLSNLAWGTRTENAQDSIRHGTKARFNLSNWRKRVSAS